MNILGNTQFFNFECNYFIIFFIFTMILTFFWNIVLRKSVQKRTEELNARTRHYVLAQEIGNIGSWERDVKTKILYWSEYIEPMFGYGKGEFKGKYSQFIDRLHPDYRQMNIDKSEECIRTGKKYTIEFKIMLPDGREKWIEETGDVVRDNRGNILKLMGVSRDITKNKIYEKALIMAKDTAEKSERIKSEFLANLSHEIRTPVTAINGFCDIIKNNGIDNENEIYFNNIINSTKGLVITINSIIDAAKLEAGDLEYFEEQTYLEKLLENVENYYRFNIDLNGNEIFFLNNRFTSYNKLKILTDPNKIEEILFNLISNSVKFTKNGKIEIWYEISQNNIIFFVRDSGVGIKEEDKKEIFKAFTQGDSSIKRKYGGLGLGLYLTNALVKICSGKLGFESEHGNGTTFYFSIPLKRVME